MATSTSFLDEWTQGSLGSGEFRPYAEYGEEEDAMICFFRPDPYSAKRLNSRVTIYLSEDNGDLVGCEIKSVRHVLHDIDWFPVSIRHGKIDLNLLFLACRGDFSSDRDLYRKIGRSVQDANLTLDVSDAKC